jgi:MFS family permease
VNATAATSEPGGAREWWFVLVLCAAAVLSIIDRGILSIVVDPVRADLGLTDTQIGLLQGVAFGLFYATAGLPLGLAADRYHRRNLIIAGITVWSLATLASGFARDFGDLFTARLLVGFGEAALAPAAVSLIADLFAPGRRGRAMGLYMAGQAIAQGLAILLTARIVAAAEAGQFEWLGLARAVAPWRTAFIVFGIAGLVLACVLLSCTEPPRRGAAATAGTLSQQGRAAFAALRGRWPLLLPLYLGFATAFAAAYGAAAWQPTMLIRVFEVPVAVLGNQLGLMTMAFSMAGPLLGGWLVDRAVRRRGAAGPLRLLVFVPLLALPSGLAVLAPGAFSAMLLVASKGAIFAVIGLGVLTTLQSQLPPRVRGVGVGLTGVVNTLVGAFSGPLLVALLTDRVFADDQRVGQSLAWVIVPALLCAALLFALAARSLDRESGAELAAAAGERQRDDDP